MAIYLSRNGQQSGPFDDEAVRVQLQSGQLSPGDLAIRQGEAVWSTLGALFPNVAEPASVAGAAPQELAGVSKKKGGCLKISLIVVGLLLFLTGLLAGIGSRFIPSPSCDLADSDHEKIVKLQSDLAKATKDSDSDKIALVERELNETYSGARASQEYCNQDKFRNNVIGIAGGSGSFIGLLMMLIGLIVGRRK